MKIQELSGKKVCILGFGKEGHAMFRAIEDHAPDAHVTIADRNPDPINAWIAANSPTNPTKLKHSLNSHGGETVWLQKIESFDVIIKSPGIPHQPEFDSVKNKLTSSTQIFFDTIKDSGAIVIGVTGSKGKSTTSTLIYEILKAGGKDVSLIGNIGEPAISHIEEAKTGKIFVMEMSSYQLMDLTVSPQIAVVTSFFPEHLDYHGSLEAYKDAKKHIAKYQTKDDVIFYCATSEGATEIAQTSSGEKIPFSATDCPVKIEETKLIGDHNRSNIAGAYTLGLRLGLDSKKMIDVIKSFRGLPHRLQSLGVHHDIEWVDDAISTTPESTIAALDALGDRVKTIILGGQDRGNDFTELAQRIKHSAVKTVILFPGTGPRIREAIGDAHADVCFQEADSMEKAVEIAKKHTMAGAIVLLSTASPSYNMFKNFEEKGEEFKRWIML
ncbi:MAG: UDP-N-acetylmuramoyl-L-alanine--D-glutamate ligase [Candidatus Peribacteraceae bacterium]|nr:UDP-N-acetylmuramoyl-L-alanine--D-glutamate ligase [Candidatus Peribacteraceae bacterium]